MTKTQNQPWSKVQWTESNQILRLLDRDEAEIAAMPRDVAECHRAYLAQGRAPEAISYLAMALPRFEAVRWGCLFLDEMSRIDGLARPEQQALDSVQRWVGEPIEAYRRAAFAASQLAREDSPERMIALAAFFSGGNVSSPDLEPVEPPPHAAGRFAGVAVLGAAYRKGPDAERAARALQMGLEHAH
ncbi:DUF6931 family protein [Novosphingobium aquimarinum]|uniref:DUF6931 family protein n=1 Tax=Novosphingobium aquimarinum TaxID=2682494 RepID=UPI0012EBFE6A|nr:hypothetical protein [Novosphingobium aquimarinum]